jgi:hypothetical protein
MTSGSFVLANTHVLIFSSSLWFLRSPQSESAAAALALKTAVTGSRRKSLPLPGVTAIVAAPKVFFC